MDQSQMTAPNHMTSIPLKTLDLETGQQDGSTHALARNGSAVLFDGAAASKKPSTASTYPASEQKVFWGSFLSTASMILPTQDFGDMPKQKYPFKWMNKLRWDWFCVYYRLNAIIVAVNSAVIVTFAAQGRLLSMPRQNVVAAVAANLTMTVLMRNEIIVNVLFMIFGSCPQWMPLLVRRLAAKIYHLGGVHSGAGIASLLWYVVFNIVLVQNFQQQAFTTLSRALVGMTIVLDVLLVSIILLSYPGVRSRFHNTWECSHRFAGWLAVAIFWVQFGLSTNVETRTSHPGRAIGEAFVRDPVFWLLLVTTVCIIWPWLRLRKIDVHPEPLSGHAIRLHFTYCDIAFCAAPRLSDAPLREWHSFAGIPGENGKGFSVIVSKAGDWTSKIIREPPTKLWVRSIPVRGVLHIAPIFKSMILVATGSGIGPVLSLVYARKFNCRILWSTPHPDKTYQRDIVKHVLTADPNAVIFNTHVTGRPNITLEAWKLYQEFQAEAVFIISNPKLTYQTVYELESRGIPAFAPIFDS